MPAPLSAAASFAAAGNHFRAAPSPAAAGCDAVVARQMGLCSLQCSVLKIGYKAGLLWKRVNTQASCSLLHAVYHANDEFVQQQLERFLCFQPTRHMRNAVHKQASGYHCGGVAQTQTLELQRTSTMWLQVKNITPSL